MKTFLILSVAIIISLKKLSNQNGNKYNCNYSLSHTIMKPCMGKLILLQDPMKDAIIVRGSMFCNAEWKPENIKNNSSSKFLTITVKETTEQPGGTFPPSVKTFVFAKLAPKEERELGCDGCGSIATGQLCVTYKVMAAVYVL